MIAMMIQQIMLIISLFLFLIGAILTSYQIFKIVELDARARGLNNPELWGLSTAGRGKIILSKTFHPKSRQRVQNVRDGLSLPFF